MRKLPPRAQIYLVAVVLAGLAAVSCALRLPLPHSTAQAWELLVFLAISPLAGGKKVRLLRAKNHDEACSMSLGFVVAFAATLRFGPLGGLLSSGASSLSACLYPTRQPLHQVAFNVSLSVLEAYLAGMVFLSLNGYSFVLRVPQTFVSVFCAALTYFLLNTGGISVIISLCSGQRTFAIWKQNFVWMIPSYLAGASVSTLAIALAGKHVSLILLFVAPVAYFTHQWCSMYIAGIEEKQQHLESTQRDQARLADLYLATIKSLALAIDAKDQYTHQHILRVQRYAVAIAVEMGLTGNELEGVNTGALLHDIGKLGVPEYVLLKPGRLTDEEFDKIKKHPEIGAAILDPVEFPWPVLPVVKYHHEKWDGTGYPEGLVGENIPLTARILAVADVYDALTSSRSYRTAWTHERATAVITKDAGTHFDPLVVDAFLRVIDGVVGEMAANGEGPLVSAPKVEAPKTKMEGAARAIQRASSELWALYEVAQTLSSSLGLQETIDILARKLEAIFPGGACLFLLEGEGDEHLHTRATVGLNHDFFADSRTLNAQSLSLTVTQTRESYLGEYDSDDLLLAGAQSSLWTPLHTALIVPIVHQGNVLGTINLYHEESDAFGLHDRQLLETIAERAALALYNGLLYDRTRGHAFTDALTGVYNIRYLTEYVESRCRNAQGRAGQLDESGTELPMEADVLTGEAAPFALLCLDLDSFKPINDNFGHQKGDQVLCDLANLFRQTVRDSDIVARYGGDEFLIVLDGATMEEAETTAARLQTAVADYDAGLVHFRLGVLHPGVSIGWACFPQDGQDCATLLSAADKQMYRQKTERKLGGLAGREAASGLRIA